MFIQRVYLRDFVGTSCCCFCCILIIWLVSVLCEMKFFKLDMEAEGGIYFEYQLVFLLILILQLYLALYKDIVNAVLYHIIFHLISTTSSLYFHHP